MLSGFILRIAEAARPACRANGVPTIHHAPDQILTVLSLDFADHLRAPQIKESVINTERRIRAAHPEAVTLFVKPRAAAAFRDDRSPTFRGATVDLERCVERIAVDPVGFVRKRRARSL